MKTCSLQSIIQLGKLLNSQYSSNLSFAKTQRALTSVVNTQKILAGNNVSKFPHQNNYEKNLMSQTFLLTLGQRNLKRRRGHLFLDDDLEQTSSISRAVRKILLSIWSHLVSDKKRRRLRKDISWMSKNSTDLSNLKRLDQQDNQIMILSLGFL